MKAQRRELRRQKRELADHNRAVNLRHFNESPNTQRELREIAALITSRERLDTVYELAGD